MTETTKSSRDDALLDALRCNLGLLHELTLRYGVETQPGRADDRQLAIECPDDVRRLLAPEMAGLAQEQVRVLLLDTKHRVVGQRVIYQGNVRAVLVRPPKCCGRRWWRPSPASSSATTIPAATRRPARKTAR